MTNKIINNNNDTNWCGGKGSTFTPPYSIFFKTSCNKHDELYNKGWDKIDRYIYDIYLLEYMKQDINDKYTSIKDIYKVIYYYIMAYIYYLAVRFYGKQYFNFKKEINEK